MAYIVQNYTGNAIGTFANEAVIVTFPITAAGSQLLRAEVVTSASVANAVKLQHSMDGTTWTDVVASPETGTTHSIVIGKTVETAAGSFTNNSEGVVPLKPLGRLICNVVAGITTTKVLVAMDR
jgi:hypothetical protein